MATTSLAPFPRIMDQWREEIEIALNTYTDFGEGCPDRLREAIEYSLLSPGKRLRPLLVLFAAEACGSTRGGAMPAACAVEMVHAYSLIHDDLPAMDDDDLRRGRPSCHIKFGEALAILAGDALLTRAFELLASEVRPRDVAASCCEALAVAGGATALVGGQVDDLAGESRESGQREESALNWLEFIHRRKTGAMFNVSVRLGGLIAEADEDQLSMLQTYSENVGLAFQIVDDLLDVAGDEDATGKRVGKDSSQGKVTYPTLLGVEESRRRAAELVQSARQAVLPLGKGATNLDALARFVVERDR